MLTSSHFRGSVATPALEGNDVPQVPKVQGGFALTWADPRWFTAATQVRFSGEQFDDDLNTAAFVLARMRVWDATVSRAIVRGLNAFVAVENILDKEFDTARTPIRSIGWPRTVRVGARSPGSKGRRYQGSKDPETFFKINECRARRRLEELLPWNPGTMEPSEHDDWHHPVRRHVRVLRTIGPFYRHPRQRLLQVWRVAESGGPRRCWRNTAPAASGRSIILIEDGEMSLRSTAVLKIARRMSAPWRWAGCLWVPRPIRDAVYRVMAANRHRMAGQSKHARSRRRRFAPTDHLGLSDDLLRKQEAVACSASSTQWHMQRDMLLPASARSSRSVDFCPWFLIVSLRSSIGPSMNSSSRYAW